MTMPTTNFEFGDIVLVPFPFTSQAASKKRPAVIVSNHNYNKNKPDVVVMAVTSQIRPSEGEDVWVRDWQAAGLLKSSSVKPVFATLEQTLIIRRLGRLSMVDQESIRNAITRIFGLPR
jgi:mRNA interferase MazF